MDANYDDTRSDIVKKNMSSTLNRDRFNEADPVSSSPSYRSLVDIRAARQVRTAEAFKLKDGQIRTVTEQHDILVVALNCAEEEINTLSLTNLNTSEENETLRERNCDLQSNETKSRQQLEMITAKASQLDKLLTAQTSKYTELLRLLETEETNNATLTSEHEEALQDLRKIKSQHAMLTNASATHEENAIKHKRETHLHTEEIRLLRVEIVQLKAQHNELKMKSTVELESLQAQLTVRTEHQYQLQGKLQAQEDACSLAEDTLSGMVEKVAEFRTKAADAETQLQIQINSKLTQEDSNRILLADNQKLSKKIKDINANLHKTEHECSRFQAETRQNGEQLQNMAVQVLELVERLKYAKLGETRAMEALAEKQNEVHDLKKKNTRLLKESTNEEKAKVKAETDTKLLKEQVQELKKHNSKLGHMCKEDAIKKVREGDERKEAEEKIDKLNSRISYVVNRLQSSEQGAAANKDEAVKLQTELNIIKNKCNALQQTHDDIEDKNKRMTLALSLKEVELEESKIKLAALKHRIDELINTNVNNAFAEREGKQYKENVVKSLANGRLRFYVESKPTLGTVNIKGKNARDRQWLDATECNLFLRKVFKSQNPQEFLLQKIAEQYGTIATMEEESAKEQQEKKQRAIEVESVHRQLEFLHAKLGAEEESKQRILLRYIKAVKASVSLGEPGSHSDRDEVGHIGAGKINFSKANLSSNEVHAIAAMLKDNHTIAELNLRGNQITDDGARALASILSGPSALSVIDLRENRISRTGIKVISDALEKSKRVGHVYVHPGGKIEALSTMDSSSTCCSNGSNGPPLLAVGTVCVVDVRENSMSEVSSATHCDQAAATRIQDCGVTSSRVAEEKTARIHKNDEARHDERDRRRQVKHVQQKIESANKQREIGWVSRAGGLKMNLTQNQDNKSPRSLQGMLRHTDADRGSLPPVRPRSASNIRSMISHSLSGSPKKQRNKGDDYTPKTQLSPFTEQLYARKNNSK